LETNNFSAISAAEDNCPQGDTIEKVSDISECGKNCLIEYPLVWNNLVNRVSDTLRLKHYAKNTSKHYTHWVKRLGLYCKHKDPVTLHVSDVRMFLEYLATNRNVSSSQQNQAFNALLFLFRNVLDLPFEGLGSTIRAKEIKTLPEVLSSEELKNLFDSLQEPYRLIAELLYGCGFRLEEGISLRIKDLDFSRNIIILKQGKGKKDRVLPLPQAILQQLKCHIQSVRYIYDKDIKNDTFNGVFLPDSLQNKNSRYAWEWGWYWLFPARELTWLKEEQTFKRYHVHETTFQRALHKASADAQITKRVKSHMLRHTFGTDLLAAGYDIRQIQDLLGHTDVRTTMIYTHVVRPDAKPIKSPLDLMGETE
jgi:integron integrase